LDRKVRPQKYPANYRKSSKDTIIVQVARGLRGCHSKGEQETNQIQKRVQPFLESQCKGSIAIWTTWYWQNYCG